jgi:hypothetical protein
VQASIVDSEELTRHIGQRHGLALDLNLVDGPYRKIGSFGGSHKRHVRSSIDSKENSS